MFVNAYAEGSAPADAVDRFVFSLFIALVVHAAVLFGVTFAPTDKDRSHHSSLEIILVQHRSERAPAKADYLAQASQEGGGEQMQLARPATPLKAPFVSSDAALATASPPQTEPTPSSEMHSRSEPIRPVPDDLLTRQVLAVVNAVSREPLSDEPTVSPTLEATPERVEVPTAFSSPTVSETIDAASLVSRSLAMASLSAELEEKLQAYAKRPRRKFISASTREYKYASYMEAWRTKVERIGNLNYPDEARRQKLSGSLRLGVALNSNGTINEIVLRRSSGHKVLDDAAIRIVKLAAPFAPFPESIRKDTDILHIERTWEFLRGNRLASR